MLGSMGAAFAIAFAAILNPAAASSVSALNVTALSSRHGYSVLECWQLVSPPTNYMSAVNYVVGNVTEAVWSRIEPRTIVGEAWAPHVQ